MWHIESENKSYHFLIFSLPTPVLFFLKRLTCGVPSSKCLAAAPYFSAFGKI